MPSFLPRYRLVESTPRLDLYAPNDRLTKVHLSILNARHNGESIVLIDPEDLWALLGAGYLAADRDRLGYFLLQSLMDDRNNEETWAAAAEFLAEPIGNH